MLSLSWYEIFVVVAQVVVESNVTLGLYDIMRRYTELVAWNFEF